MTERPKMNYPRIRLNLFHKLINLTMSRLFRAYGYDITREQEVILRELRDRDGINQADLARRVGQDRNNLSRTLEILELKGLIVRGSSDVDRRQSIVYITDQGRELHKGAFQAIEAYRRILFRGFSQQEIETFASMIERLTANLKSYLQSETTPAMKDHVARGEAKSCDGTDA